MPVLLPARDQVPAGIQRLNEARDLVGVVLQVGVHRDDDVARARADADHQRRRLAEIAPQPDRLDRRGCLRRAGSSRPRSCRGCRRRRARCRSSSRPLLAQTSMHAGNQQGQRFFLVLGRHDHAQACAPAAPAGSGCDARRSSCASRSPAFTLRCVVEDIGERIGACRRPVHGWRLPYPRVAARRRPHAAPSQDRRRSWLAHASPAPPLPVHTARHCPCPRRLGPHAGRIADLHDPGIRKLDAQVAADMKVADDDGALSLEARAAQTCAIPQTARARGRRRGNSRRRRHGCRRAPREARRPRPLRPAAYWRSRAEAACRCAPPA